MKRFLHILCLLLLPGMLLAQIDTELTEELPPRNGLAAGVFFHTLGVGGNVEYYRFRGGNDFVFGVSFASMRHRKEQKIASAYKDQGGKDYRFDKKNYFYTLAPTFGISRVLLGNTPHNKIGVRASASAGPIIGFLKPYYVEIAIPFPNNPTKAYVDNFPYDATQFAYSDIVGEADYFLGMEDIQVIAGLQLRASAILNFSNSDEYIHGLEVGLNADIYPKAVPIMDQTKNSSVFLTGSLGILFGSAW